MGFGEHTHIGWSVGANINQDSLQVGEDVFFGHVKLSRGEKKVWNTTELSFEFFRLAVTICIHYNICYLLFVKVTLLVLTVMKSCLQRPQSASACWDVPLLSGSWWSSRSPPCTHDLFWTTPTSWECWCRLSLSVNKREIEKKITHVFCNHKDIWKFTLKGCKWYDRNENWCSLLWQTDIKTAFTSVNESSSRVQLSSRLLFNLARHNIIGCHIIWGLSLPLLPFGNLFLSLFFSGKSFGSISGTATKKSAEISSSKIWKVIKSD